MCSDQPGGRGGGPKADIGVNERTPTMGVYHSYVNVGCITECTLEYPNDLRVQPAPNRVVLSQHVCKCIVCFHRSDVPQT